MATTIEYGKCAKCDETNAKTKTHTTCRRCGAPLPWATPAKPKVSNSTPARSAGGGVATRSAPTIDWGYWGVAAFSFFIPILGYFLYRAYSNNGSEKAGAAGLGALLGLLFHIARFVIRASMSQS